MAAEQYCLRWNNFHSNIVSNLELLKSNEDLVDVTISCEGRDIKAHKLLLSACSSYFKRVFKENPCPHPIVILQGVSYEDISSLLTFVYQGEVHVAQDLLESFLRTAELLQIRGLAGIAHPDNISGSDTSFKLKQDKKEIPTSSVTSCVPEVSTSPIQSSPPPPISPAENDPIVEQSIYAPTQASHQNTKTTVSDFREKEKIVIDVCCVDNDNQRAGDDTSMFGKDDQPGNVALPKLNLDERENIAKEDDEERTMLSMDWYAITGSGSDSMGQTMASMGQGPHPPEIVISYIPAAGTHLGSNAGSSRNHKGKVTKKKVAKQRKSINSAVTDLNKIPTACSICQQTFSNSFNMKRHFDKVHLPAKVECPVCLGKFSSKKYLISHMTSFHPEETKPEEAPVANVDESFPSEDISV